MIYLSQDYVAGLEKTQSLPGEVDFSSLPRDPNELFADWFKEAVDAGVRDATAVTVATVNEQGLPDARIVDLLHLDSDGFHFGTAKQTAKVRHLEGRWAAALNFWWQPLRRAVRVKGSAHRVVDGDRFNLWCVEPNHFEFFQLGEDRIRSDRVAYQRDDHGEWERIRIMEAGS